MAAQSKAGHNPSEIRQRLYPRLHAFALALTGAPGPAEALATACMRELEARADQERGQTSRLLWAYSALHTLWLKHYVAQAPQPQKRVDPRCFALPASTPEAAERTKGLARLVAGLPAQQRATLLLVYGEGLSYDEVAEIFGATVKSVMTRVVRGHVAMGHWLDQKTASLEGDDDASPRGPGAGAGAGLSPGRAA
jgi:RNA polymerase sigma-70 factor (ECF subfamily)